MVTVRLLDYREAAVANTYTGDDGNTNPNKFGYMEMCLIQTPVFIQKKRVKKSQRQKLEE